MSVLRFPRLYFRGMVSWDPGVANNGRNLYDAANDDIVLPRGVTYDGFKAWVIDNLNGIWNYYGTHTCQFTETTVITGGALDAGGVPAAADPLIGKPVRLRGKLVDLDPYAAWNSQIYFDNFAIGVWNEGELASVPGGRYLAPSASVVPQNLAGADPVPLGPCVVEVDRERGRISLDLNSTIPEINAEAAKADFGSLTLAVRRGQELTPVATIEPAKYAREAYEAQAGIVDLPLADPSAEALDRIAGGDLVALVQQGGETVEALREVTFTAQADERDIYIDEGEPREATLHVRERGAAAPPGSRVLLAWYDGNTQRLPADTRPPHEVEVGDGGTATVRLEPEGPGLLNLGLFPYAAGAQPPVPPTTLDITAGFFLCVRALPFDDALEAGTPDQALTFPFIYATVLRVYDLINPVMSGPGVGLPLSDPAIWSNPATAALVKEITAVANFESANYMPITRSLSAGKRRLLHRWCDRVIAGQVTPADLTFAAGQPVPAPPPRIRFSKQA
jgi:hypothetical protein